MKHRCRRLRVATAVLLTILTAVTACGSPADNSSPREAMSTLRLPATDTYIVPDQIRDATMVWSAEPGVDLFSTEATLTRAAQESFSIGLMLGLDYTYQGFAASSQIAGGGRLYGGFEDETGQGPFVGTIHGLIQRIIPTDSGFEVISCMLSVGLDVEVDGKFSPSGIAGGEGAELRSRFIRTGEPAKSRVMAQPSHSSGSDDLHWQAPADNQFIGWEIDGFTDRDPSTSGSGRCAPWARSLYPDTTAVVPRDAYANDYPPPVQQAYPGWSDSSN